jgi:hypothetical protein
MSVEMSIEGLDELATEFERLVKRYPDKAGELLKDEAKKLRKKVAKRMKDEKKSRYKSKRPLENAGQYSISPVLGMGARQYVEVSAKAPHFHLVEHGHDLVRNGQTVGHVQGTHFFENTVKEHEAEMPSVVSNMIDELLKEGGF